MSRIDFASADQWANCPGSISVADMLPSKHNEAQKEGTAAHWTGAQLLAGEDVTTSSVAPNGMRITDEILQCVNGYARSVNPYKPYISQMITAPTWVHPELIGRCDAWAFDEPKKILRVWNYCHGHVEVDPVKNWQLIGLTAGILESLGLDIAGIDKVHMTVYQPRCYTAHATVRTWVVDMYKLYPYISDLSKRAYTALGNKPPVHPGLHCRYCPGRLSCEGLQKTTDLITEYLESTIVPHFMNNEQAAKELVTLQMMADMIKFRVTALEEEIVSRIKSGKDVPYFHLQTGTGRDAWLNPETIIDMGKMLGVDLAQKPKPITPKQAKDAGVDPAIVDQLLAPKTGISLKRDNNKALEIFGGTSNG